MCYDYLDGGGGRGDGGNGGTHAAALGPAKGLQVMSYGHFVIIVSPLGPNENEGTA
jgi:hypothetical protein